MAPKYYSSLRPKAEKVPVTCCGYRILFRMVPSIGSPVSFRQFSLSSAVMFMRING